MGASEQGSWDRAGQCKTRLCPGLTIIRAGPSEVASRAARLQGDDLVIALSRPPQPKNHELVLGIAGTGFDGQLTSESTHTGGLVLATDLAPTILERFGLDAPSAMAGQPITVDGSRDVEALTDLDTRLSEIAPRRHTVIGVNLTDLGRPPRWRPRPSGGDALCGS